MIGMWGVWLKKYVWGNRDMLDNFISIKRVFHTQLGIQNKKSPNNKYHMEAHIR